MSLLLEVPNILNQCCHFVVELYLFYNVFNTRIYILEIVRLRLVILSKHSHCPAFECFVNGMFKLHIKLNSKDQLQQRQAANDKSLE